MTRSSLKPNVSGENPGRISIADLAILPPKIPDAEAPDSAPDHDGEQDADDSVEPPLQFVRLPTSRDFVPKQTVPPPDIDVTATPSVTAAVASAPEDSLGESTFATVMDLRIKTHAPPKPETLADSLRHTSRSKLSAAVAAMRANRREWGPVLASAAAHVLLLFVAASIFVLADSDRQPETITAEFLAPPLDELILDSEPLVIQPQTIGVSRPEIEVELDEPAIAEEPEPALPGIKTAQKEETPKGDATERGGGFFGVEGGDAIGKRIVYICDISGSMSNPFNPSGLTRFGRLQSELASAIHSLKEDQEFRVIFFSDRLQTIRSRRMRQPTARVKKRVTDWIWKLRPGGGTDPREAIGMALRLKPDTIFFLTDGMFYPETAEALLQGKLSHVRVHTFTLGDPLGEPLMRAIAQANNGTYRFIDGGVRLLPPGTPPAVSSGSTPVPAGTPKLPDSPPTP